MMEIKSSFYLAETDVVFACSNSKDKTFTTSQAACNKLL